MKKIIVSLIFFIVGNSISFGQIISTTEGGYWRDNTTWIGGIIPGSTDNVVIDGNVILDGYGKECNDITINPGDTLYNISKSSNNLKIHGNVINNGVVLVYSSYSIYSDKNITNNGIWDIYKLRLTDGTNDQNIAVNDFFDVYQISIAANVNGATSYQWYKDGTVISGATSSYYYFNTENDFLGEYYCQTDNGTSRKIRFTNSAVANGATINGKVTNALDGTAIAGAFVQIAGLSTTTDANGNYEITNIPEALLTAAFSANPLSGNAPLQVSFSDQSNDATHTLIVSADGFSTYTNSQVAIASGESLTIDVSLSPNISAGELRLVLNWGENPRDLDSYLVTPEIEGNVYTIYYGSRGNETTPPYATLDHDDTDGFGPETITIYQNFAGTYKYYIHQYSSDGEIINSNAVVQVYDATGLISSINVPTEGTGYYWNVLTIDGATGAISVINQIIETVPELPVSTKSKKIDLNLSSESLKGSTAITSWYWDFGDGTTSTAQNPSHTYTSAGNYTVSLTIGNGTDSDTETKTNYISVNATGGVILAENFDGTTFPPNNWTQTIQNSGHTWMQGNPSDNSFTNIDPTNVYSAVCPWVAENQNEWIITPLLSFPNDAITLSFYAGFSTQWLTSATIKLNISVDGGNNWEQVWEANNDGQAWSWRAITLDLSDYSNNSNIKLAWQYIGNDGDLVGIDNVKLIYGTVGVSDEENVVNEFSLSQNYPNPFNPTTVISYNLARNEFISLNVYNILGEKVAELVNANQSKGNYKIDFNANSLSSGTYIYILKAGDFIQSKKMILLK